MAKTIELPVNLADLLGDSQRVRDAFALLNAMVTLNVQLVRAQSAISLAPGQNNIKGDPPNLVLPLPLMLDSAIADSTATAASVSTQLNLLLAALRKTKMLPS